MADNENLGGKPENEGSSSEDQNKPQTIDWSKVKVEDIPVDVVKQHKLYKDTLGESVQRRQSIKEYRQQMAELQNKLAELDGEKPQPKPDTNGETPKPEADPVLEAIKAEYIAFHQQEEYEKKLKAVATKHNIPEEYYTNITGDTPEEMEVSAANLAKLILKSGISSGNPGGEPDALAPIKQRILERVKGDNDPLKGGLSPFDPGIQKSKGGGIF